MKIFNNSIEVIIDNALQLIADNLTTLPITITVEIKNVNTNTIVLTIPSLIIPAIGNPSTLIDNLTNYASGQYVVKFTLNGSSEYGGFKYGGFNIKSKITIPTIDKIDGNIVAVISGRSSISNGEHETNPSSFTTTRVRQEFYNTTTAQTVKIEYFDPTRPGLHVVSLDDSAFTDGEYDVSYYDDIGNEEIIIEDETALSFVIPNTTS